MGLWDVDPERIIIPILHCPMGLIDKILESFNRWVQLYVEDLQKYQQVHGIRCVYRLAIQQHKNAVEINQQAQDIAEANKNLPVAQVAATTANAARIAAVKAKSKAKLQFDQEIQKHNAKKDSLNQLFEKVFRKNGVKREHYHGGKFNGVNCIRLMENSKAIFVGDVDAPGFLSLCLDNRCEEATEQMVRLKCQQFCQLFGLMDAIWSTVRGLNAGLLPTIDQTTTLAKALDKAKKLWLHMKLSTNQP